MTAERQQQPPSPLAQVVLRDASRTTGAVHRLVDIVRRGEHGVLDTLGSRSCTAAFVQHCCECVQGSGVRYGTHTVQWYQLWQGLLLCMHSESGLLDFGKASMQQVCLGGEG